ncbi:MAG: hypothetical protein M3393_01390 [Actinomycetota bacterium]|nr:hypothetical protein [Actinomycetota bacterium]
MQATVSSYDFEDSSGTVLLDDGVQLSFTAQALIGSGLRLLRPGQRVRLDVRGSGEALRIETLQIVTLA